MAARAALATLLGTDPQLAMLGLTEELVFGSNATDTPPRESLFAVVHWDEITRSPGGLSVFLVSIWYHVPMEKERDYGKIDIAVLRTKEISSSVEHLEGADGWNLSSATWSGSSGDLTDDGYNSLTRYVQLRCACRNVA